MKNHLKYALSSLALLAILSLGSPVLAENNPEPNAVSASTEQNIKDSEKAKLPAIKLLAWQRVGAPISLAG